jgi:hypothetical protein
MIEPVDFQIIDRFIQSGRKEEISEDHPVYMQIRRFKRLAFYTRGELHASVYVDASTRTPLLYTDPCLDMEEPQESWGSFEEDYWAVWSAAPHGGKPPSWAEVVNVIGIEVQARSMVFISPNETGAAFWRYANGLAARITERARGRTVTIDRLSLSKRYRQLEKMVTNYREIAV